MELIQQIPQRPGHHAAPRRNFFVGQAGVTAREYYPLIVEESITSIEECPFAVPISWREVVDFINDDFDDDDDDELDPDDFDDDFDDDFEDLPDDEFEDYPDPYRDDEYEEIEEGIIPDEDDPFNDYDDFDADENTFEDEEEAEEA